MVSSEMQLYYADSADLLQVDAGVLSSTTASKCCNYCMGCVEANEQRIFILPGGAVELEGAGSAGSEPLSDSTGGGVTQRGSIICN